MSKTITENDIDWNVLHMMMEQLFLVEHDTPEFRSKVLEAANTKGGSRVYIRQPTGFVLPLRVDAHWAGNRPCDFRIKVYPDLPFDGNEYGVYVNKIENQMPLINRKCFDRHAVLNVLEDCNMGCRNWIDENKIIDFLLAEVNYGFGYWPNNSIWHNFGYFGGDVTFQFYFNSGTGNEYVWHQIVMLPLFFQRAEMSLKREIYWNPEARPLEKIEE